MELTGKRIYIIEDDSSNLALATTILKQAGAVTAVNSRGENVSHTIQPFLPVDAILLDLMLPGDISGYDVFDELRTVTDAPIIIMTAADASREMARARSKGFAGYISKPIRATHFARQIADVLEGHSVWIGN